MHYSFRFFHFEPFGEPENVEKKVEGLYVVCQIDTKGDWDK